MPDYLEFLGNGAFTGCNSLMRTKDGLIYVGKYLIGHNQDIAKDITIDEGTTVLGPWCLADSGIETLSVPKTLLKVCECVFYGTQIKRLEFPASLTNIAQYSLAGMDSLEYLDISFCDGKDNSSSLEYLFGHGNVNGKDVPDTLEELVITGQMNKLYIDSGFYENNIKKIDIKGDVKEVSEFRSCKNLQTVVFSEKVKKIGDYAFEGMSLVNINIPESIESIGVGSFANTTGIETITLSSNIKNIGTNAFSNSSLKDITLNVSDEVSISNGVFSEGAGAFSGCIKLKTLNIPESVEKIGERDFYSLTSLKSIYIPKNVLMVSEFCKDCSSLETVTIVGRTKYHYTAFEGCNNLKTLVLLDKKVKCKVVSIEENKNGTLSCDVSTRKDNITQTEVVLSEEIITSYLDKTLSVKTDLGKITLDQTVMKELSGIGKDIIVRISSIDPSLTASSGFMDYKVEFVDSDNKGSYFSQLYLTIRLVGANL